MDHDWRGSSLEELFNKSDMWANQHIPLNPSENQTILFHLPFSDENGSPQPQRSTESAWNRDNVRLPCSSQSFISKNDENGDKTLKSRWEVIKKALTQPIQNSYDLEKAIKTYNDNYANVWDFATLHELFESFTESEKTEFFDEILPNLVQLALDLPQLVQCPIPLLKQGTSRSISMSQQQCACLLANAFFCTFPYRNKVKKYSDYSNYPEINFNRLYASEGQKVIEKLKCIVNYFSRVLKDMPCGCLTFFRRSKNLTADWENESFPLSLVKYHITSSGRIEDAEGMLQVDFANKFIGGGVLGGGCVQEEIRFVINPELIVSKLFTECLDDNEAFLAIGCERFNNYSGYASSFKFTGNYFDKTPCDIYRRRKCRIIAIDATNYNMKNNTQFKDKSIRRELNKAFVGFQSIATSDAIDSSPIATGLWGCGAFNGYPLRAALIQLMACCMSQRNLAFFTFGDDSIRDEINEVFELLAMEQVNVGKLYQILKHFGQDVSGDDPENLTRFIKNKIQVAKEMEMEEGQSKCDEVLIKPTISEMRQRRIEFFGKPTLPSTFEDSSTASTSSITKFNDFDRVKNTFNPPTVKSVPKASSSLLGSLDDDYKNFK